MMAFDQMHKTGEYFNERSSYNDNNDTEVNEQ